jgi:hypothetical protein
LRAREEVLKFVFLKKIVYVCKKNMKTNVFALKAIDLLKFLYKDDIVAMSHIIIAENDNNMEIIKEYLECVEDYIKTIKENL